MRKRFLTLAVMVAAMLVGCGSSETTPVQEIPVESTPQTVEPTRYLAHGYYDGETLTLDNTVLEQMAEHFIYDVDGQVFGDECCSVGNVWVALDDAGTPNDFSDDVVLKSWTDRASDITDRLESKMSENWVVTRNGNDLHIDVQED